jgi:hypothetical protein
MRATMGFAQGTRRGAYEIVDALGVSGAVGLLSRHAGGRGLPAGRGNLGVGECDLIPGLAIGPPEGEGETVAERRH